MAENSGKNVFEDLDLTKDEIDKFKKAFEDPEFRKLFKEYAEEINDPENKKRYEEEIAQMERDKGMDIKFINPSPGHAIKTFQNGSTKVFINISHNDLIGKPSCSKVSKEGQSGTCWSLPHSFTPPRDDIDKKKAICKVYDVVFHPDTYYMSTKNDRFRTMVESIALDGIEKQFDVQLDKKNYKRLKMKFKGTPVATVIRTKRPDYEEKQKEETQVNGGPLDNFPYPYDDKKNADSTVKKPKANVETKKSSTQNNKEATMTTVTDKKEEEEEGTGKLSSYTTPSYSIKYSNNFDMQDYTQSTDLVYDTKPDKIIIEIHLPLIRSAASCDLDITEHELKLKSEKPAAYLLTLKLAYPVDENKGSARFDKSTKRLIVTLPVIATTITRQDTNILGNGDTENKEVICNESIETTQCAPTSSSTLIEVLKSESVVDNDEEQLDDDDDDDIDDKKADHLDKLVGNHKIRENALFLNCEICDDFKSLITTPATKLPGVKFLQTSTALIVLLLVKHIEEHSMKIYKEREGNNNSLTISFSSRGSGGWPMHFLLTLNCKADECNLLDSELQISCNTQSENATLNFKIPSKVSKLGALWYGSPDKELTEYRFTTGRDEINSLLAALSSLSSLDENRPSSTDLICHVTDMNKNRVTIQLMREDDIPPPPPPLPSPTTETLSDADEQQPHNEESQKVIVVENNRSKRPQKSILKLSHSESSEEGSIHGADFYSPISPLDFAVHNDGADDDDLLATSSNSSGHFPGSLRKSVSFSQREQQAVFTPGDPVSSLHQTLRNRRKKAKRQKRGVGLQRRFSESEKDFVTLRSPDDDDDKNSAARRDSQQEEKELLLAAQSSHTAWGPSSRRRNLSEGDLDNLEEVDHSSVNRPTTMSDDPIQSPRPTEPDDSTTTTLSESGFVNWSELPTVKDHHTSSSPNNPHRTDCPVALSNTITFELDDD